MSNPNSKNISRDNSKNKIILIKYMSLCFILMTCAGCTLGTYISGHHGNIEGDYPDIRTIPSREEALKDRQNHRKAEAIQRNADLVELKQDLKSAQARDQQLRNQSDPQKK